VYNPFSCAASAELTFDDVKEVTLDHVLEEITKIMAADNTGSFSISKMKEDYEAMIEKGSKAKPTEAGVVLSRKTAAELGSVKAETALKAVKEPLGAWNWYVPYLLFLYHVCLPPMY
jgi:hypothetical protein